MKDVVNVTNLWNRCNMSIESTRNKLLELQNNYNNIKKQIFALAETLPSTGNDCGCGDDQPFDYIFYGEFREMHTLCLNCGGYIEVME